jgi:hypothetical protein
MRAFLVRAEMVGYLRAQRDRIRRLDVEESIPTEGAEDGADQEMRDE